MNVPIFNLKFIAAKHLEIASKLQVVKTGKGAGKYKLGKGRKDWKQRYGCVRPPDLETEIEVLPFAPCHKHCKMMIMMIDIQVHLSVGKFF